MSKKSEKKNEEKNRKRKWKVESKPSGIIREINKDLGNTACKMLHALLTSDKERERGS